MNNNLVWCIWNVFVFWWQLSHWKIFCSRSSNSSGSKNNNNDSSIHPLLAIPFQSIYLFFFVCPQEVQWKSGEYEWVRKMSLKQFRPYTNNSRIAIGGTLYKGSLFCLHLAYKNVCVCSVFHVACSWHCTLVHCTLVHHCMLFYRRLACLLSLGERKKSVPKQTVLFHVPVSIKLPSKLILPLFNKMMRASTWNYT